MSSSSRIEAPPAGPSRMLSAARCSASPGSVRHRRRGSLRPSRWRELPRRPRRCAGSSLRVRRACTSTSALIGPAATSSRASTSPDRRPRSVHPSRGVDQSAGRHVRGNAPVAVLRSVEVCVDGWGWWTAIVAEIERRRAATAAGVVSGLSEVQRSMAAPNCIRLVARAPIKITHVTFAMPRTRSCSMS